jgi:hypothetical protein
MYKTIKRQNVHLCEDVYMWAYIQLYVCTKELSSNTLISCAASVCVHAYIDTYIHVEKNEAAISPVSVLLTFKHVHIRLPAYISVSKNCGNNRIICEYAYMDAFT